LIDLRIIAYVLHVFSQPRQFQFLAQMFLYNCFFYLFFSAFLSIFILDV